MHFQAVIMNSFLFRLLSFTIILIYAHSAAAQTTPVQILTSKNEFQIMQNGTTEITFIIMDMNDPFEIAVSKKDICYDVSELIYIAGHLTPYAREGITVNTDNQEYTIEIKNAQVEDIGTYIISVLRLLPETDRFDLVTNRSIDLLSNDEHDSLNVGCMSKQTCETTGWITGLAVSLILFVISIAIAVFLFVRLMQIIAEEEEKQKEDIYVLGHIGASSRSHAQNTENIDFPQDLYESMDEDGKQTTSSNEGATVDDDKYMIPGQGDGDNVSQFSQPEVDAIQATSAEADVDLSTDYDVPRNVLKSTGDNLEAVPDAHGKRNSDAAPTLPSHYHRQPRESTVELVASETYESISYGKYARRFRRIGKCNIL